MLSVEYQVLAWAVFLFFALLAILWKFAWGPIMHALEQREHNIQKRIDDAEKRFKDAEGKVAEYQKKIDAAKDEAAEIIAEGKRDVEKLKAEIIATANSEAAQLIERAKREITLAEHAAIEQMRDKVVELTADMSRAVLEREVNANDHRRFIENAIKEVEKN